MLTDYGINKVLADPEPCKMPDKFRPSVELTTYFRLHGSPDMYKSKYSTKVIARIARRIEKTAATGNTIWCIFDNTTLGHALDNALELNFYLANSQDLSFPVVGDSHAAH